MRESKTFSTRQQGVDWIIGREAEILSGAHARSRQSLSEAAERWRAARTLTRSDETRLRALLAQPWASGSISDLSAEDISSWRDKRLNSKTPAGKLLSPATVAREMTQLRSILTYARTSLRWIKTSPMTGVPPPREPAPRKRVIHPEEVAAMLEALGWRERVSTVRDEAAAALLLALETGMRAGEILAIRPEHVGRTTVHLPHSKNGDARDVPLSMRARALLQIVKRKRLEHVRRRSDGRLWHIDGDTLDALFRRAREKAALTGFTFHDSRATALTRLAKILSPLELARMVGHRDLNSLLVYYRETAEQIAGKLG